MVCEIVSVISSTHSFIRLEKVLLLVVSCSIHSPYYSLPNMGHTYIMKGGRSFSGLLGKSGGVAFNSMDFMQIVWITPPLFVGWGGVICAHRIPQCCVGSEYSGN